MGRINAATHTQPPLSHCSSDLSLMHISMSMNSAGSISPKLIPTTTIAT
eukprot:CAMPEP_0182497314 /NCGR_PEP_ID=MMETSP1321-20130603/5818_1 /TAXON_ID=91990 /ORGANISM="Bolidomonas sp., Strain RCC1657" /LENGTH=48 /DNA_ID= /DNA_START= /DNA_END= /DNA_ORIENTATION=